MVRTLGSASRNLAARSLVFCSATYEIWRTAGTEDVTCGWPGTGWTSEATSVMAALISAVSASTAVLKKSTQKGMTGSMLRNQHFEIAGS